MDGKPLTIGIVANHPGLILPPPPSHSVARVIETQILGLQALGHRVLLLGPADAEIACELVPICQRPVQLEEDPTLERSRRIQQRTLALMDELKDEVDIFNGHSLDIPGMLFSTNLLSASRARHVTTFHSCVEVGNLRDFRNCENPVISLSYNQRKACPKLNYVGNVYNGLDPTPFPVVRKPQGYLCFLGRISANKQPHLAIQLARCLGLPLKLAGPVHPEFDQAYFDTFCKPFIDGSSVEYLGELGFADKVDLLANALCNLHPTGFRDPCPLVPMEAGYCGTPTLAIRRGALGEIIEDGVTGRLVEDFAEGVFALEDCIALDREVLAARVRARFNRENMARGYVEVYRGMLENPDVPYQARRCSL